jgi:carbon monoxide dehydrogenase subunit G
MKIANEFTVSAPIEDAWDVLTDLEQVIPLMPGAQMTGRDGEDVLGKVKVKVGPVTSEFSGKVRFIEQDRDKHRAVIDGKGKESRGTGNAAATVTAQLHGAGAVTRVTVDTNLRIVGKLAQFGSGMLQQVSEKLLGQFVDSLEAKLAASSAPTPEAPEPPEVAPSAVAGRPAAPTLPSAPTGALQAEPAPIDLLELAGGTALKKYGPMVFGAVVIVAAIFAFGRLRMFRRAHRG